jgi:glycosyltransferase involved in cell wall biosynthesis
LDWELILVDDGSTDKSGAICDAYAKSNNKITVIHQENGGLSAARNAGLKKAQGEYVTFVDSDDFIHPQMLEILVFLVRKYNADLAQIGYSDIECYPEKSYEKDCIDVTLCNSMVDYMRNINVMAWGKLYKKNIWDNLEFPEGRLHEDVFVYHKVLCKVEKAVVTGTELYNYYARDTSIAHNIKTKNIMDLQDAHEERVLFYKSQENMEIYKIVFDLYNSFAVWASMREDTNNPYECNYYERWKLFYKENWVWKKPIKMQILYFSQKLYVRLRRCKKLIFDVLNLN